MKRLTWPIVIGLLGTIFFLGLSAFLLFVLFILPAIEMARLSSTVPATIVTTPFIEYNGQSLNPLAFIFGFTALGWGTGLLTFFMYRRRR